ncbi:MAG: fibronectin type III domain-containing protein [Actinobacteria bacterium]|uniref:Unannotated protein n=1 Tax=freshwater metagenome TaxID=449393 RepID=A0A6J7F4N4_9ZZZZ|nr:fibronectin type III domain-containing protein [Actinomycetota bacterium]
MTDTVTPRRRFGRFVPVGIAIVAVSALITGIAVASGFTAARVETTDGAVWITSMDREALGRANTRIQQLGSIVGTQTELIDVVQSTQAVYLLDDSKHTITPVDERTNTLLTPIALPAGVTDVTMTDRFVVAHASETGDVWVVPLAAVSTFDARSPARLSVGPASQIAVEPGGLLVGVSLKDSTVTVVDIGTADAPSTVDLPQKLSLDQVSVTLAGQAWAVLDAAAGHLYLPGRDVDLAATTGPTTQGILAQPSADATDVIVAYANGLAQVTMGGTVSSLMSQANLGRPAPPRTQNSCIYAAWSGGQVWSRCPGMAAAISDAEGMLGTARLSIRERGGVLALNDVQTGTAWTLQDGVHLIDNWDELIRDQTTAQTVVADDSGTQTVDPQPQPPVARDDSLGARAGRITYLPVLLNDFDPNGDVLVITDVTPVAPALGTVDIAPDRTSLRLALAPTASGVFSFGYSIDDGRGGEASARVTVTVRAESENSAPVQVRQTQADVASGGQTTLSVLGDWVDPEGDPIHVVQATTGSGVVTFTPGGRLSFIDSGASSTQARIDLEVSDGRASGYGTISISVKPGSVVPITAEPYAVLAYTDEPIRISPSDHVRGGSSAVSLTGVPGVRGLDIVGHFDDFAFSVTAARTGTYYVSYAVSDGRTNGSGLVRVDVVNRPAVGAAPVTAPHQVVVGLQQSRTIDVTATDVDPAGGVLVVTGLTSGAVTPEVRAEVVDYHIIRVTLLRPLSGVHVITYRVSNGSSSAEGQVAVVEAPAPTMSLPPIAVPDAVTVRAGNVVNIPVLANDIHPSGGVLTLAPILDQQVPEGAGLLFATATQLRYLAPEQPGTYSAAYRVVADNGAWATGIVSITVRPRDAASNRAPQPAAITARVVAGTTVRIPVELAGVDPDGDNVQLAGLASNPTKGAVTSVGADWIEYEAGPYSSETDNFTYSVIDGFGAVAVGNIRVGITPETTGSSSPTASPDTVVVRPGRTIVVDPLANDSDPGQRPLTVTSVQPTTPSVTATVSSNLVTITVPDAPGTYGILYEISNDLAGTASSFITIDVRADAPLNAPVLSDTLVPLSDILTRSDIDVDAFANSFWADGDIRALTPQLVAGYPGAARVEAAGKIRVTVQQKSQVIPFSVSHPDDPSIVSYAFIWVPGTDDARPQVKRDAKPLTVSSEKTIRININDYVTAAAGKQVRLTSPDTVRATHANGESLVIDDTTLTFTSENLYFGPASLSFEVTDGTSGDDPAGRRAVIVLPIQVTPRGNQPPILQDTQIELEPDSSKQIDLVKITRYPYARNVGELTYRLRGATDGITTKLDGTVLTITAAPGAAKGSRLALEVTPSDAENEGKPGTVVISIVASTRPIAVPQSDRVTVRRGSAVEVDVLANDQASNPFPDTPLRVIAVRGTDTADLPAGVTVVPSPDKSRLNVVVAESASASDITLQYEVADATNDPDRYAWGVIAISIQDVPDAPTVPTRAAGFVNGELTLTWGAPAGNNSPITEYLVTSDGGYTRTCGSTVCTLVGLPTGTKSRFSVVAVNGIGRSPASPWSDPLGADLAPPAPATVTAAVVPFSGARPAGGGVNVSWSAVTAPAGASAITEYRIEIFEEGNLVADLRAAASATSLLTYWGRAGAAYFARVSAINAADTADWNWQTSSTITAAGPPIWGGGLSVDAGGAHVNWASADRQGSPEAPTYYVWRSTSELSAACPSDPAAGATGSTAETSWTDTTPLADGTYWFAVFARTPWGCAGDVTSVTVTTTPGKASYDQATLTARDATTTRISVVGPTVDRAASIVAIWQVLVAGTWQELIPDPATTSTFTLDALTTGLSNPFTVVIRGCTAENVCGVEGGSTAIDVPTFGG